MTVEIEYHNVNPDTARVGQLQMARQIESERGFPIQDIEKDINGNTFVVRLKTTPPSQAVKNMLSDIEEHLNPEANHIETREV